jgi:hypothetical protein
MKEDKQQDIEKYLRSFVLRPAPRGLRKRVLDAAAERKITSPALTPFLRTCFAGCAAVLIIIFAADALISRSERARFEAFLGKTHAPQAETDPEFSTLAEITGMPSAYLQIARKKTRPSDSAAVWKEIEINLFDPHKISFPEEEF